MAIIKREDSFYGHTQDTYIKISGILIKETGIDKKGKLYEIEALLDYYTNETKQYHFLQKTEKIEGLRIDELTFEKAYLKIKEKNEYKNFEDII